MHANVWCVSIESLIRITLPFFYYLAMNYKYCKTLGITRIIFLSELKVAFQPHKSLLLNLIKPADIVFFEY